MTDPTFLDGLLARCATLLTMIAYLQQDSGAQLVNGAGPFLDVQHRQQQIVRIQQRLLAHTLAPAHAVADIQLLEDMVTIQGRLIHERHEGAADLATRVGITPEQALPLFVIGTSVQRYQTTVADLPLVLQPQVQTMLARCQQVLDDLLTHGTKTLGDLYAAWDAVLDAFAPTYADTATAAAGFAAAEHDTARADFADLLTLLEALAQQLEERRAPLSLIAGCWTLHHEGHAVLMAFATSDLVTIRAYLTRLQKMYAQGIAWLNPQPQR